MAVGEEHAFLEFLDLLEQALDDGLDAGVLDGSFLVLEFFQQDGLQEEQNAVRKVEFLAGAQNEICQLVLPREVPLQVQRAQLRDVKLQIPSLRALQVRVDAAQTQFVHSDAITRVKFDQTGNGIDVLLANFLRLSDGGQPLCEGTYEVRLLGVHLLLAAAEAAAEHVVWDAAQAPTALYKIHRHDQKHTYCCNIRGFPPGGSRRHRSERDEGSFGFRPGAACPLRGPQFCLR